MVGMAWGWGMYLVVYWVVYIICLVGSVCLDD